MPQDRTTPADIRAELPEVAGKVHPLAPGQFARSLAGSLGPSLDEIRQIGTDLGLRPYRVFLVHWQWAGEKGVGRPREISRREILPTPRVRDMSQASFLMSQFGMTEAGGIFIDRISAKYSGTTCAAGPRTCAILPASRPTWPTSSSSGRYGRTARRCRRPSPGALLPVPYPCSAARPCRGACP